MGIRALIQAAYLLLISRWLGAEGYGLFAGIVAFLVSPPLANWGSSLLLTQYIAQDKRHSRGMWATALVQSGIIGILLVTLLLSVTLLFLPQKLLFGHYYWPSQNSFYYQQATQRVVNVLL